MKIAVEGCAHGELEKIYESINHIEQEEKCKVDLLICCGDFQATRNLEDLETMAVPKKYRDICSFYKYYSGEKIAPILTIFIGGNHEASNYLQELPYGGWVAPNIYFLGYAGVVNVNGIRIAGISGIYKGHDFLKGRYEFSPYDNSTCRSVYHVRQLEVFRLKQLSGDINVFLSHDWPRGIHNFGNFNQLIRFKPYFREDIDNDKLGSPPCEDLLKTLQPSFWFAAHMHCKFAALVPHEETGKFTKFLALDKCLPRRRFLQILDIDSSDKDNEKIDLKYDLEWLTILFLTNHLISVKNSPNYMPGPNGNCRYNFTPSEEEKNEISKKFKNLNIPNNFCRTVQSYDPNDSSNYSAQQPLSVINPQTSEFCNKLGIDDPLSLAMIINGHELNYSSVLDDSNSMNTSSMCMTNASTDQISLESTLNKSSPFKRTSLTGFLPKPKENSECIYEEDGIVQKEKHSNENLSTYEIQDQSIKKLSPKRLESCTAQEIPQVKKFKRRNQDIYASKDEDI